MTRLVATDPIAYRKPARCGKRLWLKEQGFERGPQDDFSAILAKLGIEHEVEHATNDLPDHLDLGALELADQVQRTLEEVEEGQRVIYQGAFAVETEFGDDRAEVVGLPDFLIPDSDSHIIRDAKLARTIGSNRTDIQLQLQIYGWLYETASGRPPVRLEVYNGKREIDEIPIDHESALEELARILELKLLPEEPFEPVGYTKCMGCAYQHHCWPAALEDHAPGLIPAIDVGLGWALRERGVDTYEQVGQLGEEKLAAMVKPHGHGEQRFGSKKASLAIAQIEAFESGQPVQIGKVAIPEASHYVMFDVEDLPPDADGPEQVYLWGLQVYPAYGGEPGAFKPALSGFGELGDIEGWRTFLLNAKAMLDLHGEDLRFVHWHHHEKSKLRTYAERYPVVDGIDDVAGFVHRLLETNCLDLLRVTKQAFALPLPSYSLKVVEAFVGYERVKVPGYKGDQSIARYMQAIETDNENLRSEIVDEVCAYNHEDLEATWAVMKWLLNQNAADQSIETKVKVKTLGEEQQLPDLAEVISVDQVSESMQLAIGDRGYGPSKEDLPGDSWVELEVAPAGTYPTDSDLPFLIAPSFEAAVGDQVQLSGARLVTNLDFSDPDSSEDSEDLIRAVYVATNIEGQTDGVWVLSSPTSGAPHQQ